MKPSWDALAAEFEGSDKVLIADVDCDAEGEPLCSRFGIEGFPTIKYFNPPDEQGEDYEGGRDLDELKAFANALGPGCGPAAKENCTPEQLFELEVTIKIPQAEREAELSNILAGIATKEATHSALLESLQAQYEASNQELEAAKAAAKPRIKQLKVAGTKVVPAKDAIKEEL